MIIFFGIAVIDSCDREQGNGYFCDDLLSYLTINTLKNIIWVS